MKTNTTLTTFNAPVDTRSRFDSLCQMTGRTRTSVLVELMDTYVRSRGPDLLRIKEELIRIDQTLRDVPTRRGRDDTPMGFWITDGSDFVEDL